MQGERDPLRGGHKGLLADPYGSHHQGGIQSLLGSTRLAVDTICGSKVDALASIWANRRRGTVFCQPENYANETSIVLLIPCGNIG